MEPLIILGFAAVFVIVILVSLFSARKQREGMERVVHSLGLHYDPGKDHALARRYKFLDKLRRGENRYAYNILTGSYQGYEVKAFDFHYKTGSGKNTHHHRFSFFTLSLPGYFPELVIGPEGIFSKIAQAVGYDDIDFESHAFSKKFCVRSPDKKFAYDVCNARMIEFLLANRDFSIEIENKVLAIALDRCLSPDSIEPNLQRLVHIRSLMPDYLFLGSK